MIGVGGRQRREAGAVEVDAVVVQEIWILAGRHAAGAEPDLALVLVDLLDVTHHPVTLRDLVLHGAGLAVVQVQVIPAVALGHPDDFLPVRDVVAVLLPGIAEERRRLLGDHGARLPGGGGYPMTFYTQTAAAGPRAAQNYITCEDNYGQPKEYWHGVDWTVNARLRDGLFLQLGAGTGRKIIDRCDTITRVDQPTIPTNAITAPGLQQGTSCFSKEPFQTTLRGLASYTLPKVDVLVSATVRSQPEVAIGATWQVPNSVINTALGHLPPGATPRLFKAAIAASTSSRTSCPARVTMRSPAMS